MGEKSCPRGAKLTQKCPKGVKSAGKNIRGVKLNKTVWEGSQEKTCPSGVNKSCFVSEGVRERPLFILMTLAFSCP